MRRERVSADGPWRLSQPTIETIIVDEATNQELAVIDAALWPPPGTFIEFGEPDRDAIVRSVRVRLSDSRVSILVEVQNLGQGAMIRRYSPA